MTLVGPFLSLSCSYSPSAPFFSPRLVQTSTLSAFPTRSVLFVFLGLKNTIHVQEIDELVDEWTPEPLVQPLTAQQERDLASIPIILGPNGPKPKLMSTGKTVVNLASFDFAGLSGNEEVKDRAVEVLRKYGLGSCGPPGFYGTLGMHISQYAHTCTF